MKKSCISIFALTILATALAVQGECAVVVVGGAGVTLTPNQPIQAVVVDSAGNSTNQTVYYDAALGGVDLNTSWAGPNASVYFPTLGTGYVWYNGNWVDHNGYYWNGGNRVYVEHPHWGEHWNNYWHGGAGHWDGGWRVHDNYDHGHGYNHGDYHHHR